MALRGGLAYTDWIDLYHCQKLALIFGYAT